MRRLMLLRHAKTEHDAPSGRDQDRRLDERGRLDAAAIGTWIGRHPPLPDAVMVSTAVRAQQTWEIAREAMIKAIGDHGPQPRVEFLPELYGAEPTQLMVADGRNVWFLDRELEQVTVKPAGNALTATPAMLLSGSVDLRTAFDVADAGQRDGLAWVKVRPKRGDAEFREARLAFQGADLRRMELDDKLGQKAVLIFGSAVRNGPVTPAETTFTPPPGVDVIGKPVG